MKILKGLLLILLFSTAVGLLLFVLAWMEYGFDKAYEKFARFIDDIVDDQEESNEKA